MKPKRTLITDRKPITDNEILRFKKPFSSLTNMVNNSHFTAGGKSFLSYGITGLAVVAVATIATYLLTTHQPETQKADIEQITTVEDSTKFYAQDNKSRKIEPPFGERIDYEIFKINNKKAHDIKTKNGSIIHIPANTFIDKDGNEVNKDIEIYYRDFYNPFDIYLAGIPMDYDSAGINYSFMSAGMFQIDAQSNGNQLYMKEGKAIDISLVSEKEEVYNFYEYDTISNQWVYLYREEEENLLPLTQNQAMEDYSYSFSQDEIQIDTTDITLHPQTDYTQNQLIRSFVGQRKMEVKEPESYVFSAIPEMYKNTEYYALDSLMLEIDSKEKFKPNYYHVRWDRVELAQEDTNLTLILQKGSTTSAFKVKPIINPLKYKKAIMAFNEEKKVQEIRKQERENRKKMQKNLQEKTTKFSMVRNIQVTRLGTFNCDFPVPQPQMARRGALRTYDQNHKKLITNEIYVCQPDANVSWIYAQPNPYQQYYLYSGNQQNVGWFITNTGKLAILFPETFKKTKGDSCLAVVYESEEGINMLSKLMN